jgi:HSP20 family protein
MERIMADNDTEQTGQTQSGTAKQEEQMGSPRPPVDPFSALRRRMDQVVDEFQSTWPVLGRNLWDSNFARPVREWVGADWGAVEVSEDDNTYRISIELPGCEENDLDISHANGMLTVRAEKRQERREEKDRVHISERRYGSFQRTFRVPDGIDEENIKAKFKDGVLKLELPKTESAKRAGRKIAIAKD